MYTLNNLLTLSLAFLLPLLPSTTAAADNPSQTPMPPHLSNTNPRLIPWAASSTSDLRLNVSVNNNPFTVPIDTGSTGFLVSAIYLGYNSPSDLQSHGYEPAFEYLSSSHRYYEGYWVPSTLVFNSVDGSDVVSKVTVFAVTEKGVCQAFDRATGNCTGKSEVQVMPERVSYMGVGFGRWSTEQPFGTTERNPFLNVDFENGDGDEDFRQGYMISQDGVVLGVRPHEFSSEHGWDVTRLTRNEDAPSDGDKPEWRGTPMCVSVNGSECSNSTGTALFDTGIANAFLGVDPSLTEHIKTQKNGKWVLQDGVHVKVKIGRPGSYVAEFEFVTGQNGDGSGKDGVNPGSVGLVAVHPDGAFVNTGRTFFRGFDLAFEEVSGKVGVRRRRNKDGVEDEGGDGLGGQTQLRAEL